MGGGDRAVGEREPGRAPGDHLLPLLASTLPKDLTGLPAQRVKGPL